jgi:hypothetical protein
MKKNTTETGRFSSQEPNLQKLPPRNSNLKELYQQFVDKQEPMLHADYSQTEIRAIQAIESLPLQSDYSQTELRVIGESGIPLSGEPNHSNKDLIEQFQARLNKILEAGRKKAKKQTKSGRSSEKNLDDRRSKAKASRKARKASR